MCWDFKENPEFEMKRENILQLKARNKSLKIFLAIFHFVFLIYL